jgi:2-polyprenyl-3-methyl-5-hydroxy-6-metoxy-1,4-benzoquinol methylase
MTIPHARATVDETEIGNFEAMAAEWWDPNGRLRPLHEMNPVRLSWLKREICRRFGRDEDDTRALDGLTVCDVGCGGGLLFLATLNRTPKSFALAVVGAEYIMRWLPPGTHTWSKFVTPRELERGIEATGLEVQAACGMVFDPLRWSWSLKPGDLDVNYLMVAERPDRS